MKGRERCCVVMRKGSGGAYTKRPQLRVFGKGWIKLPLSCRLRLPLAVTGPKMELELELETEMEMMAPSAWTEDTHLAMHLRPSLLRRAARHYPGKPGKTPRPRLEAPVASYRGCEAAAVHQSVAALARLARLARPPSPVSEGNAGTDGNGTSVSFPLGVC